MVKKVQLTFAVPVLARTLFSPWRQIVTIPGRSLDEKFRAGIDNLVSRAVGFIARLIVLISALVLMLLAAIYGLALAVAWPFLPLAILYTLYRSLKG